VLPFVDMSADRDQEYLGDSVAEEILNVLAKLSHLRVAARTSAFAFKGRNDDVRGIGAQLGVASVLEGSIRKAGNRIRITTQLIDVANGYHLWSERFDRELDDIFAIQDQIAASVAKALDVAIGKQAPHVESVTKDTHAYDYFLRGRAGMNFYRQHTVEEALELFRKAIELDPNYAAAYAAAAEACCKLYDWSGKRDLQLLHTAGEYARRAVELAPDFALAHVAQGHVHSLEKKPEEAARAFQQALQIDPLSFEAHYQYARARWVVGKPDEAAEHFMRAAELRVEDYQALSLVSTIYHTQGLFDEEREAAGAALERVKRHLALIPDDARALYLGGVVLVVLGEPERAREWAQRALAIDPNDAATLYNVACIHARLGDTDTAIHNLQQAVAHGYAMRSWLLNDGDLVSLHDDPRFTQLVASMRD
jgi:TolB-like protein/thioredoxin-like negative regulator of GroEL